MKADGAYLRVMLDIAHFCLSLPSDHFSWFSRGLSRVFISICSQVYKATRTILKTQLLYKQVIRRMVLKCICTVSIICWVSVIFGTKAMKEFAHSVACGHVRRGLDGN
jgi:hypothetical protein